MKKIIVITSLLASLLFVSCNKDNGLFGMDEPSDEEIIAKVLATRSALVDTTWRNDLVDSLAFFETEEVVDTFVQLQPVDIEEAFDFADSTKYYPVPDGPVDTTAFEFAEEFIPEAQPEILYEDTCAVAILDIVDTTAVVTTLPDEIPAAL